MEYDPPIKKSGDFFSSIQSNMHILGITRYKTGLRGIQAVLTFLENNIILENNILLSLKKY